MSLNISTIKTHLANQTLALQTDNTTRLQIASGGLVTVTGDLSARGSVFHGDVANVKAYGATGDGITDDSTAIENAIKSGAVEVFFPAGTYNLNRSNATFTNDVRLRGQGTTTILSGGTTWDFAGASIDMKGIKFYDWNSYAFWLSAGDGASNRTVDHYIFQDCHFDQVYAPARGAVDMTSTVTRLEMKNCTIKGAVRFGIYWMNGVGSAEISQNYITHCGSTSQYGMQAFLFGDAQLPLSDGKSACSNIHIHHNTFYELSGADDDETHAILINGDSATIDHNSINGIRGTGEDHEGIYVKGDGCIIDSNTIHSGAGDDRQSDGCIAIKDDPTKACIVSNNVMTGLWGNIRARNGCNITGNSFYCVSGGSINIYSAPQSTAGDFQPLSGQAHSVITGNTFYVVTGVGITYSDAKNVIIANNYFENKTDDDSTDHGIRLQKVYDDNYGSENVLITNNIFTNFATCVKFMGDSPGLNVRIIDNIFTNGGVSNPQGDVEIRGNGPFNVTENQGVASIADGGTIAHGLFNTTPNRVQITGSVAGEIVTVTSLDDTNITVAIKDNDGSAGTTQNVYWDARRVFE